jgi:hypothetical protein
VIALYICLGVIGFVALFALFVWFSNSCLMLTNYKIEIADAPQNLKIVHLSDLHGKSFKKGNKQLLQTVKSQSPDVIAITGDIIHLYTKRNIRVATEIIPELCKIAPVIYVSGNHEMRSTKYRILREQLKKGGAIVLDDCKTELCGFTFVGLNCASLKNGTIFSITPDISPKILLAHEPQFLESYKKASYDLVLSGHAHGGQWRIPFTKIGIFSPGQGLLPKYTSGIYKSGKTQMVVSRGLGNSECPLRLFNRPEVVVISVTKKENTDAKI